MKKSRNGGKRLLKTSAPRPKKRLLGACILFMTVALALATAVLAAGDTWADNGSYSLVIQKQFAADTPEEVLKAAKNQTYTFHIEGYSEERNGAGELVQIPIKDTVTINKDSDWKAGPFYANGPIHVSVTEITNDITLEVNGQEYSMGDSRAETATLFEESPQVRELKNNGKIVLSRPTKKLVPDGNGGFNAVPVTTTSTFRITSEWTAAPSVKPPDWDEKALNTTVLLAPGETHTFENLPAGKYTIEDLSVSGYTIKLGPREETVGEETQTGGEPSEAAYSAQEGEAEKQTGTFYINSYPGTLKITAGGTRGDGGTHYYTVKRVKNPSDARPFVDRTTDAVASGETYTLDDLPKGQYEVTEYTFTDAPTEFKVKVPKIKETPVTKTFKKDYIGDTEYYTKFSVDADYITDLKYGPLRNSSNGVIKSTFTYNFGIRYRKTADQEGYTTSAWRTNTRKANTIYSFTSPIYPRTDGTLAFAVWGVTATSGDHVDLSWVENKLEENTYTAGKANVNYSITIDDHGRMEITAPKKSDTPGAESVTYTYTLRKEADGEALRTVTLQPGQIGKFEGLEKGTYLLMETLSFSKPVGFKMDISGGPFGSGEAGKPSEITVMGERILTITKPQGKEEDTRDYTFIIDKVPEKTRDANDTQGERTFPIIVRLKAGQTSTGILLPAGTYTVTPADDMTEVFELTSSDTSQVHAQVPSNQAASVTFTNVFTAGEYGYRYVHEYYIQKPDGTYQYEGCSPVTTVGGRSEANEFYNSVDITKEPTFTISNGETYTYAYMPENNGYGRVSTVDTGGDTLDSNGLRRHNHAKDKVNGDEISYDVDDSMTADKKIGVDKNKSQIIILRYFRVLPKDQRGHYKYIHVYYRRDKDGYHWEGSSGIGENVGQLNNVPYRAGEGEAVHPVTRFQPKENNPENQTYDYVYDQRPGYGTLSGNHSDPLVEEHRQVNEGETTHRHYLPNSDADHIVATADGNNIIILRYYREVSPTVTEGTYNVVHEYYFREKLEDQDQGDISEDPGNTPEDSGGNPDNPGDTQGDPGDTQSGPGDIQNSPEAVQSDPEDTQDGQGNTPVDSEESEIDGQSEDGISPQSDDEEEAEGDSSFSGTLSSDDRYSYTFEGARTVESIKAPLGSTHKGDEVGEQRDWKPNGSGTSYRYTCYNAVYGKAGGDNTYNYVSNMEWASSTEEGDEIIILRYYREEGGPTTPDTPPDKPDQPDKPGGGGGGGGKDPDPTPPPEDPKDPPTDPENPPTDPENPPTDPEVPPTDPENPPTDPENPPTDPEHPTELPDPNDPDSPDEITIWENGVPKTYVKVWDPENEVWVYIPEEDVPLWNKVPQTGDESRTGLWAALAAASLCGLAGLTLLAKKRKNR